MLSGGRQGRSGRRRARWWALIATAPLALLSAAAPASAGSYSVAVCDLGVGTAFFERVGNLEKFKVDNDCTNGGSMRVTDDGSNEQSDGQQAGWSVESGSGTPSSLAPTGITFVATGKADRSVRPYIEAARRGVSGWSRLAGDNQLPSGSLKSFSFDGGYTRLRAVLRCTSATCGEDSDAFVRIKRIRWQVSESAAPTDPALAGTLMQQPAQRGLQSVDAGSGDSQSGIFAATIQLNGTQLTTLPGSCANGGRDASGRISLGKWRPCTNEVAGATTNTNDGTAGAFREGMNEVRACVSDFAGNSSCGEWRQVRVDNRCPIAPGGDTASPAASLAASFGNGRASHRVRFPARPRIEAVLHDAGGGTLPTNTSSICATEKVALSSRPGARVVTPAFPSGGSLKVPAGSSRQIWVNYWLDGERVLSARLRLKAKPRLGLRVRPKGTVNNGETMSARANLRGPLNGRRRVIFKVRAGGETQRLGADRTNSQGVAKVRHQFSQIQGSGSIRVRAYVPRQRRFPYLGGASPSRKVALAP